MTETAQMNGPSGGRFIDTIDPEDPEYIRQMRRPAEVKEDVAQMEQRQRVSLILTSKAFRDELERISNEQISNDGKVPPSLEVLKKITELVAPSLGMSLGGPTSRGHIIPIADLRGVDSLNYGKGEKLLRCKLASCYRLVDLFGWSNTIHNHITARISQDNEHFLVNPHGLLYSEITASNLLKVDMQGEVVDQGSTTLPVNTATYVLHSAVHAARPDIRCILHLHTSDTIAVSTMECGLLALSQEAMIVGESSTFEYNGSLADQEDRDKVARALGPNNKILFLRNFGALCCGESVEEAFYLANNLQKACECQVKALPAGVDKLTIPSEELQQKAVEFSNSSNAGPEGDSKKTKYRRGELEYEALMRHLDNSGYRSGYLFRDPNIKRDMKNVQRANAEVEVPPVTTSFAFWDEDGKSPMKQQMEQNKKAYRSGWLSSPNAYQKEEIEDRAHPTPKKSTKWVPGSKNITIQLDNPNQFAPISPDPKELKAKHEKIRKNFYDENIHAGPQSKILEGITWEEAQRIKEGQGSGNADATIIVGAASKGIIQRDSQHSAVVYKTYYAPNPFDNMSEEEIERYKAEVEHRKGGGVTSASEAEDQSPGEDGKLISTEERMQQVKEEQEPSSPGDFKRSQSARYTPEKSSKLKAELQQNFDRKKSKSERKPKKSKKKHGAVNGDDSTAVASPSDFTSGDETSKDPSASPTKDKKKKKKFRMPSFSKTKKEK